MTKLFIWALRNTNIYLDPSLTETWKGVNDLCALCLQVIGHLRCKDSKSTTSASSSQSHQQGKRTESKTSAQCY